MASRVLTLFALCALAAGAAPARAASFSKTIDRRFPAFQYCPIDNDTYDLTFTAETSRVKIRIQGANRDGGGNWLEQRLDNMTVVPKAVFDANRIVTPGFSSCYLNPPGPANYRGYDFDAPGTTENFLDLFDGNAAAWDLTNYAFYDENSLAGSAPRDPEAGSDRSGGALAMGAETDGSLTVSTDFTVTGLTPGTLYVLTGWWYIKNLSPLTFTFDTNPCADADGDGITDCAGDCNDADPKIRPGAAEVCDGRDNNCNGSVDDNAACVRLCTTPAKQGSDVRVTNANFVSSNPSIAWNGVDYALLWKDSRNGNQEIFFTRVSPSGTKLVPDVSVSGACSDCNNPRMVWNGSEYGAVWEDNGSITFRRIDRNGAAIGGKTTLLDLAGSIANDPDIAWTGSEYGVVWDQFISAMEIRFARLDRQGNLISRYLPITDNSGFGGNARPRIAWSGTKFGITYQGDGGSNQEIFFTRFDPRQGLIGTTQITTHGQGAFNPSLAWTGADWGVAWQDNRIFIEIYFQRVSDAGTKVGNDVRITSATGASIEPSLAWTGSEYGVVWDDDRSGDLELYFSRIQSNGAKLGTDLQITTATGTSQQPAIAWGGSKFGVVWNDDRFAGDQEILYLNLGCNCVDADVDGSSSCVECDDSRATVFPGATQVCGDALNNDCNDANWPLLRGTNEFDNDGDGFTSCGGDCSDTNASIWATPGEVRSLLLSHNQGTGTTTLSWTAPAAPGGTSALYDTLRSTTPSNFTSGATCVESNDGSNTAASDATTLAPGGRFFYLVRAENACPSGQGVLGRDSAGNPVAGRTCP